MLKRPILGLLCLAMLLGSLTGCVVPSNADKLTVVTVIFPEYDWVRQILDGDDRMDLKLLCDDGVDPHSFQPTVGDMVTVAECDLLIFGGGESDEWLRDAITHNPDITVLELLPLLGENAHTTEITEGMQVRESEAETDEHIWLSLRNAMVFCEAISDALCAVNPAGEARYRRNLAGYLEKLEALDQRYQETILDSRTDTLLVCDRFPLRYLVEDYGLRYYAAFPGCSAESGASFATIVSLADRMRELELNSVLILEGSDGRIARTVAENSGREQTQVLTFHSMQAVSLADALTTDYLTIMEQNRQLLETALK